MASIKGTNIKTDININKSIYYLSSLSSVSSYTFMYDTLIFSTRRCAHPVKGK